MYLGVIARAGVIEGEKIEIEQVIGKQREELQ